MVSGQFIHRFRCRRYHHHRRQRTAKITHGRNEHFGTMGVVAEHVEARAGGRQQHNVAGLGVSRRCRDGGFERGVIFKFDTGGRQRLAQARGITADQQHGAAIGRSALGQWREVLPLAVATGDQDDLAGFFSTRSSTEAVKRGQRRADIGALAVVDVSHPVTLATGCTRCGRPV